MNEAINLQGNKQKSFVYFRLFPFSLKINDPQCFVPSKTSGIFAFEGVSSFMDRLQI